MTAEQKPEVFFPPTETPDKPQLAQHLLTKSKPKAALLHQLLPVRLHLKLDPLLLTLKKRSPTCSQPAHPYSSHLLLL